MTARVFNATVVLGLRDCLAQALAESITARPLTSDQEASWQDRARDLLDAFDNVYLGEVAAHQLDARFAVTAPEASAP